jgi:nucleotide-binding universal stress UspA family protein
MQPIRTVLCPVDFSPATARQVDVAADLARAFGARLILHHNMASLGTGASVGWMWNADHPPSSQDQVEARLREHLSRLGPGLASEARITQGPRSHTVLAEIEAVDADLVVLSTHGTEAEDHASITEQVLARARRYVLVLHDEELEQHTPHFASGTGTPQVLLVPTDLTPEANVAVGAAFDLARRLPVELHLLHLLRPGSHARGDFSARREQVQRDLMGLVPADLASRVRIHIEDGEQSEGITRIARATSADCIVMGQHTRSLVWRWFGRDTARDVLRQAPCPVWYIPADRAA